MRGSNPGWRRRSEMGLGTRRSYRVLERHTEGKSGTSGLMSDSDG